MWKAKHGDGDREDGLGSRARLDSKPKQHQGLERWLAVENTCGELVGLVLSTSSGGLQLPATPVPGISHPLQAYKGACIHKSRHTHKITQIKQKDWSAFRSALKDLQREFVLGLGEGKRR